MLTLQDEIDIYDLLKQGFSFNEEIPIASIALYLNSKGISYQEYGYKKLKSLIDDLSFLTTKTDKENHSIVYVSLHQFSHEENKKDFSDEEKKKIKNLLLKNYQPNKKYQLSEVSKYLVLNHIRNKDYGFSKMRKLLEEIDGITLIEDKNNPSIIQVSITKEKAKKIKPGNKDLPEPKEGCFFIPNNLILSMKLFTNLGLDNDSYIALILKDYTKAYLQNSFQKKDDAYIFSLSFKSKDNENLIASIKKAAKGSPYPYYINFIGSDKEKAKDYLLDKIFFADYEGAIKSLAEITKEESWCYHNSKDKHIILKIYLQYTFYQIISQNKLKFNKATSFACFNTGLKNEELEDIYAILLKSKDKSISQEYIFQGFTIAASQGLGKIIIEQFNPLPEKASYINSDSDLIFKDNAYIHTDYNHIILDNLDRFPLTFLQAICAPFKNENKIVTSIAKERNAFIKDKLYTKLEKCIEANTILFNSLKVYLESSVNKAIRLAKYDFRNALPSFFPTRNVMSLMLPLTFYPSNEIQAVLLIEKTPALNYQGQTILTLKQCYVNARLIGPLENTYLNPKKIED